MRFLLLSPTLLLLVLGNHLGVADNLRHTGPSLFVERKLAGDNLAEVATGLLWTVGAVCRATTIPGRICHMSDNETLAETVFVRATCPEPSFNSCSCSVKIDGKFCHYCSFQEQDFRPRLIAPTSSRMIRATVLLAAFRHPLALVKKMMATREIMATIMIKTTKKMTAPWVCLVFCRLFWL